MNIANQLLNKLSIDQNNVWWASADNLNDLDVIVNKERENNFLSHPTCKGHKYRFVNWGNGKSESIISSYEAWRISPINIGHSNKSICFMYSGQGSQYVGMASDLWNSWEWFRRGMQEMFSAVEPINEASLSDVMLGINEVESKLNETNYTQPIVYALEVMLTKLWERWGLKPASVMGHSLGEFAAAYEAGVISDIQGMKIVAERGRIMQKLNVDGKYVFVRGELADVVDVVSPYKSTVSVAGINAPDMTVVSGPSIDVDIVINKCEELGMKIQILPVSLPFHSPMMRPILDEFEDYANHETFSVNHTPWFSTMTGGAINSRLPISADYWRRQIEEPVRFWACMENISEAGEKNFLEIGPGQSLMNMGRHALGEDTDHSWRSSLNRNLNDRESLFRTAINLWLDGFDIDLNLAYDDCFDS